MNSAAVRIGAFGSFLGKLAKKPPLNRWRPYRRNFLDGKWEVAGDDAIFPGQLLMLDSKVGGYDVLRGWTGELGTSVPSLRPLESGETDDEMDGEILSTGRTWESISGHTDEVCASLGRNPAGCSPRRSGRASASRPVARPRQSASHFSGCRGRGGHIRADRQHHHCMVEKPRSCQDRRQGETHLPTRRAASKTLSSRACVGTGRFASLQRAAAHGS